MLTDILHNDIVQPYLRFGFERLFAVISTGWS